MAGSMTVRELLVRIRASFDKRGTEEAKKGVAKFTQSVNNLNKRIVAGLVQGTKIATATAAGLGVALVKAGANAEESESKFEAVFKGQAAATRKWSDELAKSMGRSAFQIRDFASGIQDTLVPMGLARDEAAQLSRNLVELASDVGSFNDTAEPEVIQRFTGALIGSHENVAKFGAIINEASLKEKIKELSDTMPGFSGRTKEMQKVLARYQIIMDSTSDAHGDATKTAGSFTNQVRSLKSRILDVSRQIGMKLIPILTPMVTKMVEWVKANEDLIKVKVEQFFRSVISAGQQLFKVGQWIVANWDKVKLVLGALATGYIASGIAGVASSIMAMGPALKAVASNLKIIGAAGAALGVGWVIGRKLDEWLNASKHIADALDWIDKKLTKRDEKSKKRVSEHDQRTRQERLVRTRERLMQLRSRGVQSVQGIGLDDAGINRLVAMQAQKLGINPATSPAAMGSTSNSFSVGAPQITVNVPPGTQASQAQRVAEAAGSATRSSMRSAIGDVAR